MDAVNATEPDSLSATVRRYGRTVARFWWASLSAEAEYRMNFVLAAVGSLITLAGSIGTLAVLYQHGYQMGGWAWPEAMLVVAIYTMLDGLQQALLSPNRQAISWQVREGTLDFVLLKPIDSQYWLSVRRLSVWGIPNLAWGAALLIYAGQKLETPLALTGYLAGLVPLALGIVILYALGYILATLTIWITKADNITIAMQALLEAGRYPIPAYAAPYRVFFTFVLPVAFITTVPAQVMTGRGAASWLLGSLGIGVVMLVISRWFWRFALRHYTSASS